MADELAQYSTTDPYIGFMYILEVGSRLNDTIYFTECGGLNLEIEAIQHKVVSGSESGGSGGPPRPLLRQLVGATKWADISLKRGITSSMDLWDWFEEVQNPPSAGSYRTDGSISLVTYDGSEVARWNFTNAWPSKVSGPSFKSDGNEFGIEEVVLVHEGLERAS